MPVFVVALFPVRCVIAAVGVVSRGRLECVVGEVVGFLGAVTLQFIKRERCGSGRQFGAAGILERGAEHERRGTAGAA